MRMVFEHKNTKGTANKSHGEASNKASSSDVVGQNPNTGAAQNTNTTKTVSAGNWSVEGFVFVKGRKRGFLQKEGCRKSGYGGRQRVGRP